MRCRDVFGKLVEFTMVERELVKSPQARLDQRLVVAMARLYLYKSVPLEAGRRDPYLYTLLDNEVRAGCRLGQVFRRYPKALARLVAYNVDVEEPFVLFDAYVGEPAADHADRFDDTRRWRFQVGLLKALQHTAAAGVVHGAVNLDAVRWDPGRESVQLINFESSQRVGDPRNAGNRAMARSPEQLEGSGLVDARDDMWGVGLLIRALALRTSMNGARMDRGTDPQRLRNLLDPIFDHPAANRPGPTDLLRALHEDSPMPMPPDLEGHLAAGRQRFDQVSAHKRAPGLDDGGGVRRSGWRARRRLGR